MARLLVDSSVLVWALFQPGRLTATATEAISGEFELLVSSVSIYELLYKWSLGKLPGIEPLASDVHGELSLQGIKELPLTASHALMAARLNLAHKDPFDRLIAGQAIVEDIGVVTNDRAFDLLGATRVW